MARLWWMAGGVLASAALVGAAWSMGDVGVAVADAAPAPVANAPATRPVDATLRGLAVGLPEPTLAAMRRGAWKEVALALAPEKAAALRGDPGDIAFLRAWAAMRSGDAALISQAAGGAAAIAQAPTAPSGWKALVLGTLAQATGDAAAAARHLDAVPTDRTIGPRAALVRARLLADGGDATGALAVASELAARPDPAEGSDEAIVRLARATTGDEAYALWRRVWSRYPGTDAAKQAAEAMKAGWPDRAPTADAWGRRAEGWLDRQSNDQAIEASDQGLAVATSGSEAWCRLRYVKSRAKYKKNELSGTVEAAADGGTRCRGVADDYAYKLLYLVGQAEHRRGRNTEAAVAYRTIADHHPASSYADDGLTRAGIALQDAGDLAGAQKLWRRALAETPTGDNAPEASWRLAWSLYLAGAPAEAITVAEALGALPLASDAVHVAAGRYWSARWRLFPDVANPHAPVDDATARETAISGFERICRELPHSYYAALAFARLEALDPARADALRVHPSPWTPDRIETPWQARVSFLDHPRVADAVGLARLGLVEDSLAEFSAMSADAGAAPNGEEMAWLTELRIAGGDWLLAHEAFRKWLEKNPLGTLGPAQERIVRVAYPDRYWAEVKDASLPHAYDPRLFHALVREESNFNKDIVSFAGAKGLTQLMPATARDVAGWMGISVSDADLYVPEKNLKIGGRYLQSLHQTLSGSPYLMLAAYNAGPGRVKEWLGAWGNVPADEFAERIPFRETRGYVKRVMGTWQTYRWQFDDIAPFPALAAFNDDVRPAVTP